MLSSNITRVDLKIDQDWSKVIDIYDHITHLWKEDKLHNKTYLENLNTYQYDLGVLGSLTLLDNISDKNNKTTSFLHGKIVESNLPWIKKLKSDLQELNVSAICLIKTEEDVLPHNDRNDNPETPTVICKLNYIIKDSNAIIYVDNNGIADSSPAVKDSALLMNVAQHHWVKSNHSPLYTLQICFYKPYNEVLDWFRTHPALYYN